MEEILKERFAGKLLDICHNKSFKLKKFRNFSPADSLLVDNILQIIPSFLNKVNCDWIYSLTTDTCLLPYILGFFSLVICFRSECFSKARPKWIRYYTQAMPTKWYYQASWKYYMTYIFLKFVKKWTSDITKWSIYSV